MKFCDKLPKLRKEKNFSQEQLAEKLNVSRQAVSKWESGSSYPDMEKLIEICKILNCNLDELMDDGVIGSQKNKNEFNVRNLFDSFLKSITKIYNMFLAMSLGQKLKCIFEMLFIFFILLFISNMIELFVNEIFIYKLSDFGFIYILFNFIFNVIFISLDILAVVLLIHLFKIRYLDYYITIEDNHINEKIIEKEVEPIIKNEVKEKIIIRDPKHSSKEFSSFFGKIFDFILSLFCIVTLVPFSITFVIFTAIFCLTLFYINFNIVFLWLSILILGVILFFFVLVKLLYNLSFNKKINFSLIFILFISSLILVGIGGGLSISKALSMEMVSYVELDDAYNEVTMELEADEVYSLINKQLLQFGYYSYWYNDIEVEIIINNDIENVKLEFKSFYDINQNLYLNLPYSYFDFDFSKYYNMFFDYIANDKLLVLDNFYGNSEIVIHISAENYDYLMNR